MSIFKLRLARHCLRLLSLPLMAAGCASAPAAQVATAPAQPGPSATAIPGALAVPEGNRFAFEYQALGVQIYECKTSESGDPQWQFSAPEATLYDRQGRAVATHAAGPSWTALDGSKVVGTKLAANGDDKTAIPWLLLSASEHSGAGVFAAVSFIQRLETRAGLAPAGACDPNDLCGKPLRVPYSASYVFYTANP